MQTLALDLSSVRAATDTVAEQAARRNLSANVAALRGTQPDLLIDDALPPAEWVFARDGSVTALAADGWLAGCSLPVRAARQQLKAMDVRGPAGCFLDPPHAAHLRVALDKLGPHQAMVALFPGPADLGALLACHDLSTDFAAHRLWIVAGGEWPDRLARLFRDRPGLPTPTHFVRLAGGDPGRLDPVIAEAQRVFAAVATERSHLAQRLASSWRAKPPGAARVAVATGRRFRLWDDAGAALAEVAAVAGDLLVPVCADDPLTAGTLALLDAAVEAGAVMLADVGRSDLPDLFPRELPWLTWATTPRLPAAAGRGPNDHLLVADPAWRGAAVASGWPEAAVSVARWPAAELPSPPAAPPHLAVFADLPPTDPPERLDEFSSHRLLWTAIRDELSNNPFAAGIDADAYLRARVERFNVDPAKLDRALFVRNLIEPVTAVGVVRTLAAAGLAVRAFGDGWSAALGDAVQNVTVAGPVRSREELRAAAAAATALVDVRPVGWWNGLWSLGRPVVAVAGRSAAAVARDAMAALAGRVSGEDFPKLDGDLIRRALGANGG